MKCDALVILTINLLTV